MVLLDEKMNIIFTEAMYIVDDAKKVIVGIVPNKKDTSNMVVQWKNDDQIETYF